MNKQKRFLALIICMLLLFMISVSYLYIVLNAEHDCVGLECEICEQITFVVGILKSIVICVILIIFICTAVMQRHKFGITENHIHAAKTLVEWRVRLDN